MTKKRGEETLPMMTKLSTPTVVTSRWERKRRDVKDKNFVLRKSSLATCIFKAVGLQTYSQRRQQS